MNQWVMGLGASMHNGAVCLLKGDEIIVAIQEERLVRTKRAGLFGGEYAQAIEYCLNYAKIHPRDLSLVVCCSINTERIPPERRTRWWEMSQDVSKNPILDTIANHVPTLNIPHHHGHALSAFATSGFEESAILVIDGVGSPYEDFKDLESAASKSIDPEGWEIISLYVASGTTIKCLEKHVVKRCAWLTPEPEGMPRYGSLGGMYSAVGSQIFGEVADSAGKVMGLAPYGKPVIPASEFFSIEDNCFKFNGSVRQRFKHNERWPLRQQEYADLASSVQVALEEAILYLVQRLYKISGVRNLCYAGGVALNSVANERIVRESPFENVYICPAAEDSGTAIGAAYHGLWHLTKTNTRKRLLHDAVGPAYSREDIQTAIHDTPAVELIECEDVVSKSVDLLCEGKIIGWFEGRSELGPRALGQRSILCDPRRPDAKDVLNSRVKHRESFRPFAPVVLHEAVKDWFELDGAPPESPFMLRICEFKPEKRALVPGVVHVDATGRFQTVTKQANGRLYDLVKRFYDKTGVPIILNTSFNIAGEPIIEQPRDALSTMLRTGIDYCVLEDHLVGKRRSILFERNEEPWPQRLLWQVKEILGATPSASQKQDVNTHQDKRRPLPQDYVGVFEREAPGTVISIEMDEKDNELIATITGDLIQIMGARMGYVKYWSRIEAIPRIVCQVKQSSPHVLVVTRGMLGGYQLLFPPDKSGVLSCLVFQRSDGTGRITFLRQAHAGRSAVPCDLLAGEYKTSNESITVSLRNGKLMVGVTGEDRFELVHVRALEFILKNLPGYGIAFKTARSGGGVESILTTPSRILTLPKRQQLGRRQA
jgi:carbamoyltransferase